MSLYIDQLRAIPAYRVILSRKVLTKGARPQVTVVEDVYPSPTESYSFDDAVDVLTILSQKWIDNYSLPEEGMLPRARSISSGISFTLWDISPELFSRVGFEDEELDDL